MLAEIISQGTMEAAARILAERGQSKTVDTHKLCAEMRAQVLANYDTIAREASEALGACGEQWARQAINAWCVKMALDAISAIAAQ